VPRTQVALQIWDIGGQSIGGKMIGNYIYGAQAVLLCYDITNYSSFQDLEDWYNLVQRTFRGQPMPRITLIGNKTDLNHLRTVNVEKHNQFADENEVRAAVAHDARPQPPCAWRMCDHSCVLVDAPSRLRTPQMFSCFMSAKTGDNVTQCFHRIAADLAGVVLTKPELEIASKVVRAEIVNHPRHNPSDPPMHQVSARRQGGCVVQ
jgi:Ras-related protein Rab-28